MNNIKLIVLDVDGTLTDGKIIYGSDGTEYKSFNVKDGMGISLARKAGIEFAIITGRESKIVTRRATELNVKYVYQGVSDKSQILSEILALENCVLQEVAYIGDDLNDMYVMKAVGFAACPADASDEVKQSCQYVATKAGGDGAVREIIEHILKTAGKWDDVIRSYDNVPQ